MYQEEEFRYRMHKFFISNLYLSVNFQPAFQQFCEISLVMMHCMYLTLLINNLYIILLTMCKEINLFFTKVSCIREGLCKVTSAKSTAPKVNTNLQYWGSVVALVFFFF